MKVVKVRVFSTLIEKMGWKEKTIEIEGGNIADALRNAKGNQQDLHTILTQRQGDSAHGYIVLLNGREIEFLNGLETPVTTGDTISIFPPLAGG